MASVNVTVSPLITAALPAAKLAAEPPTSTVKAVVAGVEPPSRSSLKVTVSEAPEILARVTVGATASRLT